MAALLTMIALLAAIDALFPLTCLPHHILRCVETHSLNTDIHYLESSISAVVLAAAILLDALRRRKLFSWIFLIIQLFFGVLALIHNIPPQLEAVSQFIYETILLVWLLYVLEAYDMPSPRPRMIRREFRLILALWVAANGVLTLLVSAAHLRLYGPASSVLLPGHTRWDAQLASLIGVLLLYLARQIYRGQRRAAYILLAIFGLQLCTYSLIHPQPVLTMLYGASFILVFLMRHTFMRNSGPINVHRRILDLVSVIGGVLLALLIVTGILLASGRLGHVVSAIDSGTDYLERTYQHHENRSLLRGQRLRETGAVLASTTLVISIWILFRPARFLPVAFDSAEDKAQARYLLERYSHSSEDFFKLWPENKAYFFGARRDSFIAYRVVRNAAFALADPIGSTPSTQRAILQDFAGFCTEQGWTMYILLADEASLNLYGLDFNHLPIGASAVIDIQHFMENTQHEKWWRWKTNQAEKAGLQYSFSTPPHSQALLTDCAEVSNMWLRRGGRREQSFAMGYFDVTYLNNCRLHYVTNTAGAVVAFNNELPVFNGTQATIDLLRYRNDEPSAMPYLLKSYIAQLHKEERFTHFDLGFVPLAQLPSRSARLARAITSLRYSAAGLEQFKNKFRPDWRKQYVVTNGDLLDLTALAVKIEVALKYDPPAN
jgi:phosphatidylglycerol lysyltransferase